MKNPYFVMMFAQSGESAMPIVDSDGEVKFWATEAEAREAMAGTVARSGVRVPDIRDGGGRIMPYGAGFLQAMWEKWTELLATQRWEYIQHRQQMRVLKGFAAIAAVLFLFALSAAAQTTAPCPVMPAGTLCVSQQAGNVAVSNAKELEATKQKVTILEDALKQKDADILLVQQTAAKNVADLTAALHSTELKLATATGQLIGTDAERVRLIAMLEAAMKNTKKRKYGLVNIF